jgi:hypothetical protein
MAHLLTTVKVEGMEIDVEVRTDGEFQAFVDDQTVESPTLTGLEARLREAIHGKRLRIPFILAATGRAGVIRGYHASQRKLLVTWDDGEKDTIGMTDRVWQPGEVSDGQLDELRALLAEIDRSYRRRLDLQSGGRAAKELLDLSMLEVLR